VTSRRSCLVYGLGVRVNVPIAGLAGLPPSPGLDVTVTLGSLPTHLAGMPDGAWREYYASPEQDERGESDIRVERLSGGGYFRIAYPDGTVIVVDAQGSRVWATWTAASSVEDAATYLLGPTLGFVLRLRGFTCLHASAIAVDGRSVALVGPPGSGKSTTAAAFARLGYPVLTDDVLALVDEGACFTAQPAYPRVRLWPESVASMFGSAEALPRIVPGWDKRFLDLNGQGYRFQQAPLPLAAIYFLGDRSAELRAPSVEAAGAREGLISLVANTCSNYLLDKPMRATEFQALGRLIENVPLRRVVASDDFARLPELCSLIADDCRHLAACSPA
jgi:hypothetical protein